MADGLGPQKDSSVPKRLAREYDYLMSPMSPIDVGLLCGDDGVAPEGHEAMERLFKKKRWTLIESILRGYNPEARVYAAIALLRAERSGRGISPELKGSLDAVLALEIPISTCVGDVVGSEYAAEVVKKQLEALDSH